MGENQEQGNSDSLVTHTLGSLLLPEMPSALSAQRISVIGHCIFPLEFETHHHRVQTPGRSSAHSPWCSFLGSDWR